MFTLKIETANDAFGETEDLAGAEVARIMRELADRLERGMIGTPLTGTLRDLNGNKVGSFSLTRGRRR